MLRVSNNPAYYRYISWKYPIEAPVFSSLTIVNGMLYVCSTDHFIYATAEKRDQNKK